MTDYSFKDFSIYDTADSVPMKKSYVTTMPDDIGAFLKASRCFAKLGINIIRVSYNKAVDTHTLFIDVEGEPESLAEADEQLSEIGYIHDSRCERTVMLMEFILKDEPGSVTGVLELITRFGFNISYISSQADGSGFQRFRMGLSVDDTAEVARFVSEASALCKVNILDYNSSGAVYDNSVFYSSFVSSISRSMDISEERRRDLLVYCNMAMQNLDEKGLSPHYTFDAIGRLAELLIACRGDAFNPRISRHEVSEGSSVTVIEPPCGSNVIILESDGETLFVDTGYACYREETLAAVRSVVPGFDGMRKKVLVTHADLDHIGLCPLFDEVLASENSALCMREEYEGRDGFRESNPLHKPYIGMCKILTGYEPVPSDIVKTMWPARPDSDVLLYPVGFLDVGKFGFEVYEGRGGHLKGEIILIDYCNKIALTGDVYVNVHGMTEAQAQYNRYAPILMNSVDTDPDLCKRERDDLLRRLGPGDWMVFGGHGSMKELKVRVSEEKCRRGTPPAEDVSLGPLGLQPGVGQDAEDRYGHGCAYSREQCRGAAGLAESRAFVLDVDVEPPVAVA